jgi:hypothetical protein
MANEKGLMGKIMGMMTDDKGMFQGGKRNRMFGRLRDTMEGAPTDIELNNAMPKSYVDSKGNKVDIKGNIYDFFDKNPKGYQEYLISVGGRGEEVFGKGYGKVMQDMFTKNFDKRLGDNAVNTYYSGMEKNKSSVDRDVLLPLAFDKGSQIGAKTDAALNSNMFNVQDLVKDVAFAQSTPERSQNFNLGREYRAKLEDHLFRGGDFPKAKDFERNPNIEDVGY